MINESAWKNGYGFYKADANKCAEEILSIQGEITCESVLEKAKDENSELHKCFDWDDSSAAKKWRLKQAGDVIRLLVRREEKKPEDRPEIRVFQISKETHVYKPVEFIVQREDEYKALLARAWAELRAFKRKYACLEELREILDMID